MQNIQEYIPIPQAIFIIALVTLVYLCNQQKRKSSITSNFQAQNEGSQQKSQVKNAPKYKITFNDALEEVNLNNFKENSTQLTKFPFMVKQFLSQTESLPITEIRELRQKTHDGSTLHIDIDISNTNLSYQTAQNLSIFPQNTPENISRACKLLDVNPESLFEIQNNTDDCLPFPSPITTQTYLTNFCDLIGPVQKKTLKQLASFCEFEKDRKKLLYLVASKDDPEFGIQVTQELKGILDIIEEYNCKVSLADFIEIANPMRPRSFTIASSSAQDPNCVQICASIQLDKVKRLQDPWVGCVSRQFVNLKEEKAKGKNVSLRALVKPSTFKLPENKDKPILMIGAGTGVAPFLGFLQEKQYLKRSQKNENWGEMSLIFGCKARDWDFIYDKEIANYKQDGALKNFYPAFSREQTKKVYVQDVLERETSLASQILFENSGLLYICGSVRMGKDIRSRLISMAQKYYKYSSAGDAEKKIEEMEKQRMIIKELWG